MSAFDVDGLNAILTPRTGWRVVAVPGWEGTRDALGDLVVEAAAGGTDLVQTSLASYTLESNVAGM